MEITAGTHSNVNVFSDIWIEESKYLRRVKRFVLAGSDHLGEVLATLQYGQKIIGEIYNSVGAAVSTGLAEEMVNLDSKEVCLPSEELSCWLNGTSATNNLFLVVEIEEIAPPRRRGFRGRGRGRRFGRRRSYARRGYRRRY